MKVAKVGAPTLALPRVAEEGIGVAPHCLRLPRSPGEGREEAAR